MRKQILLFAIFLYACAQMQVRATGQSGELLVIGKDTLQMLTCPIEADSVLRSEVQQRRAEGLNTGCWRGYIGIWRLEANRLYLEKILDRCGERPYTYVHTDSLFDKYKDKKGRILASWFNGNIRVVKGKVLAYEHMEFNLTLEYETFYRVKNGKITRKRTYHNTQKKASVDKLQTYHTIQNNFNGDLFPELSDKRLVVQFKILPSPDGKIDSLTLILKAGDDEFKEYAPDHPYVMELKRCLDIVPDWEVSVFYGKRKWKRFIFSVWRGKGCKTKYYDSQCPDSIFYNDTLYALKEFPLQYDTRLYAKLQPYLKESYDKQCQRNYTAIWELSENRLYLKSIRYPNASQSLPLNILFPDAKPGERIEATWYSGKLPMMHGKNLKKFRQYYPREIDCEVEKGQITRQNIYQNYMNPRNAQAYESCVQQLKALDWNKDPHLDGQAITVEYIIQPNLNGTAKEIQVKISTRGLEKDQPDRIKNQLINDPDHSFLKICRDALAALHWEVVYVRNEIMPVKGTVYIQNMRGNAMDTFLEKNNKK